MSRNFLLKAGVKFEVFVYELSGCGFESSCNEDVVPRDRQAHDRAFKLRWLIEYLNEGFLSSMKPKVEQSEEEHVIKYKGRSLWGSK